MRATTNILQSRWDISCIKGDRLPPLSFKIAYFDGEDCEDYEPEIPITKSNGVVVQTLTATDGLSKVGAVTRMNLSADFDAYVFNHREIIKLNNGLWKFTVAGGSFAVRKPNFEYGGTIGTEQKIFKLPVIKDADTGVIYLVDENGNPVLDENGEFIIMQ